METESLMLSNPSQTISEEKYMHYHKGSIKYVLQVMQLDTDRHQRDHREIVAHQYLAKEENHGFNGEKKRHRLKIYWIEYQKKIYSRILYDFETKISVTDKPPPTRNYCGEEVLKYCISSGDYDIASKKHHNIFDNSLSRLGLLRI